MTPRIVERPAFHVVGMTGRFLPETMGEIAAMWGAFAPRMASIPGVKRLGTSYGVCRCAPPSAAGPSALEYTACVEVAAPAKPPAGMVAFTIPAATYAVFTHTGPIQAIGQTWDAIHQRWLREAGLEKAGDLDFEVYDERWDPRTGEGPVDIHVPVHADR